MLNIDSKNNITMFRGDTAELVVNLTDNWGAPLSIEGGSLVLSVKESYSSSEYILQKMIVSGKTFSFTANDTKDLNPGRYVYDIQLTYNYGQATQQSSIVSTLVIGEFILISDVTTSLPVEG